MYQARRDVVIMRQQRSLPRRSMRVIADLAFVWRAVTPPRLPSPRLYPILRRELRRFKDGRRGGLRDLPRRSLPRYLAGPGHLPLVTTLVLGIVSSVFDNVPLTKMALDQGGYDSALLAYSVGLGGSMVWFGSSAGVAVSGFFPEARSVLKWLRQGWHVPVAFVIGYLALYGVHGWNP